MKKFILVLFAMSFLFGCYKKEDTPVLDYRIEEEKRFKAAQVERHKLYFTIDRYYKQWENLTTEDMLNIPKQENNKVIGGFFKSLAFLVRENVKTREESNKK